MSIENEFQRAKREQELALQTVQEEERKSSAHRKQLCQAMSFQRQALVAQWTTIVSGLLNGVGQTTWGRDGYTLISPDGATSLSWFVVHVKGKLKLNFQVTLQVEHENPDDLSLNPEDELVRPSGFIVTGTQTHYSVLSEEGIKNALVEAYKDGVKGNGLDRWAEAVLANSPYKKDEFEDTNMWILIPTLLTFLAGFYGLFGAFSLFLQVISVVSDSQMANFWASITIIVLMTFLAAGIIAIAGIALWRTKFGSRFQRLGWVEKVLVVVAAFPGSLLAIVMSAGLIIVVLAIMVLFSSAAREGRVSEIEDGVRRGMQ